MRAKQVPKQNCTFGINVSSSWRVASVSALPHYRLKVTFIDGLSGYVDMSQFVMSENAGVFSELRNLKLFNQVHLDYGVVTWPGEQDLAPDAMYEKIKQYGEWVLMPVSG